ncbi:hypothetical protein D3C85_1438630 [compost metagenome]
MAVLTGDAIQALDLRIDGFVLLKLVILLQPARVFEQHIGFGGGCRDLLVRTGKGHIGLGFS